MKGNTMIDYRKETLGDIKSIIGNYAKSETLRAQVFMGLLGIAVYHSIKDGQCTPGIDLLASIKGAEKIRASLYLTKYGNFKVVKEQLQFCKAKSKAQWGIEKANEVFENLPDIDEAFPAAPKQFKDVPFFKRIKTMIENADDAVQAGRSIIFNDDQEKELYNQMVNLVQMGVGK